MCIIEPTAKKCQVLQYQVSRALPDTWHLTPNHDEKVRMHTRDDILRLTELASCAG